MEYIVPILQVYMSTLIVVHSNLLVKFRAWLNGHPNIITVNILKSMSCRLCFGFWATIVVLMLSNGLNMNDFVIVYGISYFISTQERG